MTLIKTAALLLIITLIFVFLIFGKTLLIPFIIAIMIWYLINAFSHWFNRLKFVRDNFPGWIILAFSAAVIALIIILVGGLIAENAKQMYTELPKYQKNLLQLIERFSLIINYDISRHFKFSNNISDLLKQIDFASIIKAVLNTLSGIAGNTFLIIIYVLFLLLEQAVFPKKLRALFTYEEHYRRSQEIIEHINEAIRAYFKVKLTVSLITAITSYILMALVGVDFAVFWAFLIFILNFIPNIGSLIATIFPATLALVQFNESFTPFIIILVGVGAIQIIVGNLIEPRMMGSSLNISSLVVILALTLWGAIWGIAGMILCVPITVILMIILSQFSATRPVAILLSEKGELFLKLNKIYRAADEEE